MTPSTRPTTRQSARLLLRWAARLVLLAFSALVLGALAVVVVIPRATQGQAMTVLTGSMTPGIPVGSIVVVRPVDPGTLHVGDVATYQKVPGKPVFVTHRITRINASTNPVTYTFKGDANRGPDLEPVVAKQIRGQVWFHVPYLGAIRDGLHGRGGVTLVAMLALGGYALSQLGAGLRERRSGTGTPGGIPVNRTLVVATLDRTRLSSILAMTPAQVAHAWGAVLVHEDDTTCTLLQAPAPDDVETTLDLLHQVQPLDVRAIDQTGTLTGLESRSVAHEPARTPRVRA